MYLQQNLDYTLFDWSKQGDLTPIEVERAEGCYFWDSSGKRYLDWNSQIMNVNIGHGNRHVIDAIHAQAEALPYVSSFMATRVRGELGEKLAEITPGDLRKTFFTLGGAEAVENAMKIARMVTGRDKIVTRYRAYHGATAGAASAGGDPRRLPLEPGVPWIVRAHDPYRYRCLFCRELDGCNLICEDHIEQTIEMEGPQNVAAVLLEGWSGSSGLIQSPRNAEYFQRLRRYCDRHGILLIIDEVMSGFGRTGKWFAIEHADVVPDIMVMAKGLTSGYLPLGAVTVRRDIADHFDDHTLWAGLTYGGHPMCLAAASACVDVYRNDNLIERAAQMGQRLRDELTALAQRHAIVGELRGEGMFYVLELVRERATREPLSPWNGPLSAPMRRAKQYLDSAGLYTYIRWNMIFSAPPLILSEAQLQQGIAHLDQALTLAGNEKR
ncbi:MAG: aminotransferase class III-fold pyridoxal phosphate-dependent enzyme [Ardenticatenales bacterium]|nr:aminotransferase class III-fold pyridoxal phosphate-dependent enzyme [Ardenticatenales bacterium]